MKKNRTTAKKEGDSYTTVEKKGKKKKWNVRQIGQSVTLGTFFGLILPSSGKYRIMSNNAKICCIHEILMDWWKVLCTKLFEYDCAK